MWYNHNIKKELGEYIHRKVNLKKVRNINSLSDFFFFFFDCRRLLIALDVLSTRLVDIFRNFFGHLIGNASIPSIPTSWAFCASLMQAASPPLPFLVDLLI